MPQQLSLKQVYIGNHKYVLAAAIMSHSMPKHQ